MVKKVLLSLVLLFFPISSFFAETEFSAMSFFYEFNGIASGTEVIRFISDRDDINSTIPDSGIELDVANMSSPQFYLIILSNKPNQENSTKITYSNMSLTFSPMSNGEYYVPYEVRVVDADDLSYAFADNTVGIRVDNIDRIKILKDVSVDAGILEKAYRFRYIVEESVANNLPSLTYSSTVTFTYDGP